MIKVQLPSSEHTYHSSKLIWNVLYKISCIYWNISIYYIFNKNSGTTVVSDTVSYDMVTPGVVDITYLIENGTGKYHKLSYTV